MIGELEAAGTGRWQLSFTRKLAHPADKVWQAITKPEHLTAWFPQRIEGDLLTPGAPLRFVHSVDAPSFEGRVLTVEPPSVLEFQWGPDTIRLDITPASGGCTLTLTDTIDELGKAARDAAGWHTCLDFLEAELGAGQPSLKSRERWQQVHGEYVAKFGPEAATIGPPEGF
jgi:uncharacterized protein YndB with AHSA1/START domain